MNYRQFSGIYDNQTVECFYRPALLQKYKKFYLNDLFTGITVFAASLFYRLTGVCLLRLFIRVRSHFREHEVMNIKSTNTLIQNSRISEPIHLMTFQRVPNIVARPIPSSKSRTCMWKLDLPLNARTIAVSSLQFSISPNSKFRYYSRSPRLI